MTVEITSETADSADAQKLIQALNAELTSRYDKGGAEIFEETEAPPRSSFLVARSGEEAVGCGGLYPLMGDIAEVKGLFVTEEARAQGVGKQLLQALEQEAQTHKFKAIWLTAGRIDAEAIMLFVKSGFEAMDCYGENLGNPLKVCFKKLIDQA